MSYKCVKHVPTPKLEVEKKAVPVLVVLAPAPKAEREKDPFTLRLIRMGYEWRTGNKGKPNIKTNDGLQNGWVKRVPKDQLSVEEEKLKQLGITIEEYVEPKKPQKVKAR